MGSNPKKTSKVYLLDQPPLSPVQSKCQTLMPKVKYTKRKKSQPTLPQLIIATLGPNLEFNSGRILASPLLASWATKWYYFLPLYYKPLLNRPPNHLNVLGTICQLLLI